MWPPLTTPKRHHPSCTRLSLKLYARAGLFHTCLSCLESAHQLRKIVMASIHTCDDSSSVLPTLHKAWNFTDQTWGYLPALDLTLHPWPHFISFVSTVWIPRRVVRWTSLPHSEPNAKSFAPDYDNSGEGPSSRLGNSLTTCIVMEMIVMGLDALSGCLIY